MRFLRNLAGICLAAAVLFTATPSPAQTAVAALDTEAIGPETKLPLPRYVSLRSGEVNMRRGPGLDYRIDWVFQRPGLPVRIVDEYGHWRRVLDSDDTAGWVYHALLTSRRTALVVEAQATLRAEPDVAAEPTAHAEQGVVTQLLQCQRRWCRVQAGRAEGWILKTAIWGVDPTEEFGG